MACRIVVVSASIGAGHDGAARELARRLQDDGFDVAIVDFLDLLPGRLGRLVRGSYAKQLNVAPRSWDWLLRGLERYHWLYRLAAECAASASARRMRLALAEAADLVAVVSTYPLASQSLGHLRRHGELAVPVVTFLTDMSVHPLWVSSGVDAHLALHDVAAQQARRLGARSVRVAGPAVAPAFRPPASVAERVEARTAFRLPETAPLALVVAGSWGVGEIEHAVRDIRACGVVETVVACGHNEALRERLTEQGLGIAIGWTDEMPTLVRACDVVIQNAGGLSSLEALASGVPVITYRCLPGHGRTNAEALDRAGWAVWIHDARDLASTLKRALAGEARVPVQRSTSGTAGSDPAAMVATMARAAGVTA
jgi:UDP-N-acetylglucosamine:LPS N-acetylglucosamine transferase